MEPKTRHRNGRAVAAAVWVSAGLFSAGHRLATWRVRETIWPLTPEAHSEWLTGRVDLLCLAVALTALVTWLAFGKSKATEALVVCGILGLAVAVASPAIAAGMRGARERQCRADMAIAYRAIGVYALDWDACPETRRWSDDWMHQTRWTEAVSLLPTVHPLGMWEEGPNLLADCGAARVGNSELSSDDPRRLHEGDTYQLVSLGGAISIAKD